MVGFISVKNNLKTLLFATRAFLTLLLLEHILTESLGDFLPAEAVRETQVRVPRRDVLQLLRQELRRLREVLPASQTRLCHLPEEIQVKRLLRLSPEELPLEQAEEEAEKRRGSGGELQLWSVSGRVGHHLVALTHDVRPSGETWQQGGAPEARQQRPLGQGLHHCRRDPQGRREVRKPRVHLPPLQ